MSEDSGHQPWVPPSAPAPTPPPMEQPVNPYQPGSPYATFPYAASSYGSPPYTTNPYGRFPGHDPVLPPPSQGMAGWALGLSFLPCAITLLLSAIFAIVTLARSSDGRDYGKKKAIGALCVAGGWLAIGITVVVVGGIDDQGDADRNDAGQIEESGEVSVSELREGDCWQEPDVQQVYTVEAVPCHEDHQLEVYADVDLTGPDEVTQGAINQLAFRECRRHFAAFVGRSYQSSGLDIYSLTPRPKAWALGDRRLTCSVYQPAMGDISILQMVRGTLRNSGR